jgi:hypothetical protein
MMDDDKIRLPQIKVGGTRPEGGAINVLRRLPPEVFCKSFHLFLIYAVGARVRIAGAGNQDQKTKHEDLKKFHTGKLHKFLMYSYNKAAVGLD